MRLLQRPPRPARAPLPLAMSAMLAVTACAGGELALPGDGVPASAVAERGDNQTARVGRALPESLVVRVLDATGAPLAGVTVQWEAQSGGSVSPASSVTDAEGRTAAARVLGETVGTVRTIARAVGPTPVPVAFTAVATPAPVPVLALARPPSPTAVAGRPLEQQPIVQVRDDEGTPVREAGRAVTAAIAEGGGTLTGTVTQLTDAEGRATFSDLAIQGAPGERRLLFAADGVASVTSAPIAVEAAAPTQLVFLAQPSPARANGTITPAVRVGLADEHGRPVSDARATVTIEIASGPAWGDLRGTTRVAAQDGVAVFSNLRIDAPGLYTLRATAPGLAPVTSVVFEVDW